MLYNFAAESFHTKKLCSRLFCERSTLLEEKWPICVFEPPLEGLGATQAVHLRLIGKLVVDFLLVTIDLFSLGVRVEAVRAILSIENRRI